MADCNGTVEATAATTTNAEWPQRITFESLKEHAAHLGDAYLRKILADEAAREKADKPRYAALIAGMRPISEELARQIEGARDAGYPLDLLTDALIPASRRQPPLKSLPRDDNALLAACAAHRAIWDQRQGNVGKYGEEVDPNGDAWAADNREIERIICSSPAAGLAGIKAKAAAMKASVLAENGGAPNFDQDGWEPSIQASIAADILRFGGEPEDCDVAKLYREAEALLPGVSMDDEEAEQRLLKIEMAARVKVPTSLEGAAFHLALLCGDVDSWSHGDGSEGPRISRQQQQILQRSLAFSILALINYGGVPAREINDYYAGLALRPTSPFIEANGEASLMAAE